MKKYQYPFLSFALGIAVMMQADSVLAAAYAEFNPAKAEFVSPNVRHNKKADVKNAPVIKSPTAPSLSAAQVKNLVFETMSSLAASGALRGEKGEKGDKGETSTTSRDIDSEGNLTVAGNTELRGNTALSTTTISGLFVGVLESDSGAHLSKGGAWVNASNREIKENFAIPSTEEILGKIASLSIYSWNYKAEDSSVIHIGPMAEDFYDAFNLGGENGNKNISTIDPAGVALAGIQALNEKLARQTFDISWFLNGLKDIGIEITDGIMKVKEFTADRISAKTLEVGTSEKPDGITLYDRATGEPVCVFSENVVLKTTAGKCGTVPKIEAPAPEQETSEDAPDTVSATSSPEILENNQEQA